MRPAPARLQRLWALAQRRAQGAVDARAVALELAGRRCGSLEPALAERLAAALPRFLRAGATLRPSDPGLDGAGCTALLEQAARWLVQAGVVPAWRDEAIDVADADGTVLATIDRCAVRALGITTHSARLNGRIAPDRLVVALRAPHKRVDPGRWDNIAGGLVGAGEDPAGAIVREAHEEAGLELDRARLVRGSDLPVCRRLADGLIRDVVHVFDVDLAADGRLANRDGEVERFEIWPLTRVLEAIEDDAFTVEAALAILDSLRRRAPTDG